MDTFEAMKTILKKQGLNYTTLGRRLGKDAHLIGDRFRQKSITTKMAAELLRGAGYKIVLMPDTAPTPKDGFEIE